MLIVMAGCKASQSQFTGDAIAALNGMTIRYVGNMGVLISNNKTTVLVDGLHAFYQEAYLHTPDTIIRKIMNREGQYAKLEVALVTHFHRDHYSASLSRDFLASDLGRLVAGSGQVIDSLNPQQSLSAISRNGQIYHNPETQLTIHAFDIPHTWQQRHSAVQNIGYLVRMDGTSVMHIGDADTQPDVFRKLAISEPDVLIIPSWFLSDKQGLEIIKEILKPKQLVVTHISPNDKEDWNRHKVEGIPTYFFTRIAE